MEKEHATGLEKRDIRYRPTRSCCPPRKDKKPRERRPAVLPAPDPRTHPKSGGFGVLSKRSVAEPVQEMRRAARAIEGFGLKGVSSLSGYRHHVNDPSAGSPTDTLLRLLRPLPQIICPTSQPNDHGQADHGTHPYRSLTGTIGRSDGRCVQRAGT